MRNDPRINQSSPEASPGQTTPSDPKAPAESEKKKPLSKDEQMALYEDDLKENDWGHQPC